MLVTLYLVKLDLKHPSSLWFSYWSAINKYSSHGIRFYTNILAYWDGINSNE